ARGVVSLRNRSFEQMLEKILEDLLERKGVIYSSLGERVSIPEGELVGECDGTQCYYGAGFQVIDAVERRVLFGHIAGMMIPLDKDKTTFKILSLEVYSLH
ncbi:MAG: hypothetical protein ACP5LG_08370, partial [Conexivisphaera sp.]